MTTTHTQPALFPGAADTQPPRGVGAGFAAG